MKILVITQAVDSENTSLGYFLGWLDKFSNNFEQVLTICLFEGKHGNNEKIKIYSLGKENNVSKFEYVRRFLFYIWKYRNEYEAVFVHMNQEYILLGGIFWLILEKPIYFWRNHPHGDIWTRMAIFFSKKVFCTSMQSFTARFKKTIIMPAGIDTDLFKPSANILRDKNSICMVGRIAPIKKIDLGLSVIKYLIDSGTQVSLTIVGESSAKDMDYYTSLTSFVKKYKLEPFVKFVRAVSNDKLPEIYSSHMICLNLTESGSFDKTIVEATACGLIPLVANESLRNLLPDVCLTHSNRESIANSIETLLRIDTKIKINKQLDSFAMENSLDHLMEKLVIEIE